MAGNKRKHLETKRRKFEAKSGSKSDTNLFEFHRNKVKHNIIGRKVAKNEVSNKGLSRNKSYTKRKNTILQEYKSRHKTGKGLQDLRNKDNEDMKHDLQEAIEMSFDENTVLTHKGRHLKDFMDDHIGSDDEDLDLFSRPDFVESTHFGGGSDGRPKSANEVLNQIMDEKRDKQLERQANIELTQKLDTEWMAVKSILRHKSVRHELPQNTNQDYDILVKELMFDTNKPISRVQSVSQTMSKSIETNNESTPTIHKSTETLFKQFIEAIEVNNNWTQILALINGSGNHLLSQISEESLSLLFEKYQTITEIDSDFNCHNLAIIWIGCHFKQTKLIVRLILIQMLSKLKINSFNEIAIVLVIIRLLLMTANGVYIPQVVDSLMKVLRLSQQKEAIEPTVGHKNKDNCSLAVNEEITSNECSNFNIKYIFDETFTTLKEIDIKCMLLSETLKRLDEMLDSYAKMPSFNELIAPLKTLCLQLSQNEYLNEELKELMNGVLSKVNASAPRVVLSERRRKPFMLPMFEPKFDDNSSHEKKNSKKRLTKKYNRELKGAQRELRKDSTFMRNTWIEEITANDDRRKTKVKQLMGDLAQQQGLYKKSKK